MSSFITRQDAEGFICEAIEAGDSIEDARENFDVEAIADDLHARIDSWDIENIDEIIFWATVEQHAYSAQGAHESLTVPAPDEVTPSQHTDELLSELVEQAQAVAHARESLAAEEAARDRMIVDAYRTGSITVRALASLAGVSHGRVSQVVAKARG